MLVLKVPSSCLISIAIVWLEEMSFYSAFDFNPGLITPALSLAVHFDFIFSHTCSLGQIIIETCSSPIML